MTVFGRLDIQYPDGRLESHQLRGDEITVGSANTNSIQLADESVSDRHFSLNADTDGVTICDLNSRMGTFVGGQRIPAETPLPLRNTATIAIGPLQLVFYKHSDSPTVSMPALNEQTQPALTGFRASLDQAQVKVFPASSATVSLSITNTGASDAEFRVETSGLPDDWVKPDRLNFPLPANEATQLQFLIKPARRSDIPPRRLPLNIHITRLEEPQQTLRLIAIVELGGFGGLSLALDPPICLDRDSFSLYLLNQGNEPLSLALESYDPQSSLDLRLAQSAVTLPPGGRLQIDGEVRSQRRPLVGNMRELPFALLAKADNPTGYSVALPARVSIKPYLSSRAAALLTALIATLALVAALALFQPPEPEISSVTLSEAQVAQGTPVQLNWTADHAQRFVIEVNRAAVAELPADTSSYFLDTSEYFDPIDIALIAQRGEMTVIESRRLDVYEPVVISQFYSNRTSMLRKVIGTLTVRWEVEGAVSLDISQPIGFETVSESKVEWQGEIVLRGAPIAEFEILLNARDEIGATVQRSLKIAVRDPECTPLDDTLLYAGPDSRYAQVKIAMGNVPILVRGTNATRDWLQVELASGLTGWGNHRSFICHGFDPSALEIVTDIPPLPTATATSTPTATPGDTPSPTSTVDQTPSPAPDATTVGP